MNVYGGVHCIPSYNGISLFQYNDMLIRVILQCVATWAVSVAYFWSGSNERA